MVSLKKKMKGDTDMLMERKNGSDKGARDSEEDVLPIIELKDQRRGKKRKDKCVSQTVKESPSKRRMLIMDKTMQDLTDDDKSLLDSDDDESKNRNETGTPCNAGEFCYNGEDKWVVVGDGSGANGSECSKCKKTFHNVCLFEFEDEVYCLKCYNEFVVSNCSTQKLFRDIFQVDPKGKGSACVGQHTESQLRMFVDNYLISKGYKMTFDRYHQWRKEGFQIIHSKPKMKKQWTLGERRDRLEKLKVFLRKNHKYETVIRMAKDEWILSTDGLVCGLRYKGLEKSFLHR
jgi:hypothetical protein